MNSSHTLTVLSYVITALLSLGGCAQVEEPVAPLSNSPDKDLSMYLDGLLETARAMPTSPLARGRLGMAYDVNGLQKEALLTYQQAAVLDSTEFL